MRSLLIITLLTAASMLPALGQERAITAAEFEAIDHAADAPFKAKQAPAKMTFATESLVDGRPQTDWVSKTVLEFGPNGSKRQSVESSFGGVPLKKESSIKINGRNYTRSGDGAWKEESVQPDPDPIKKTDDDTDTAETRVSCKYLGSGVLNGKKVQMYLRTESRKQTASANRAASVSEAVTKYWFGENSDFYKYEYQSTTKTGDMVSHTKILLEKEFDPTISISAPVM